MIEWRDVPGFEDDYQVSSDGQVRSKDRIRIYFNSKHNKLCQMKLKSQLRTPSISFDGYKEIHLQRSDTHQSYYARIHRLVATAFIPNPENKPQVNHIDGNKQNNCVENLEWVTAAENTHHAMNCLHGVWMRNNKSGCIRIKCLDEDIWFDSMLDAGEWAGGNSSNLIIALKANKPYKGHVFLREQDLEKLDCSESEYVAALMQNYRGKGQSIRYSVSSSDGQEFRSQSEFCQFYNLDSATISDKFIKFGAVYIDGVKFVRNLCNI